VSFLNGTASLSLDYKSEQFSKAPFNAFTVLRSRFDRWYAGKVEEAGAILLTGTTVEDLLWDGDRVVGVKTGRPDGDLLADVVIAADGVNSLVARKGGFRNDLAPDDVSLGIKEILALPKESINRAFALTGDEGAAYTYVGAATMGIPGGGFLYTNRDSISVGVVTKLSALSQEERRPEDLLEAFKQHPVIRPLIKDGELREYLAHLIPDGYQEAAGPVYRSGLLAAGDAAGFTLNTGLRVEGVNYSIMSGLAAAEAVQHARKSRDFSHRGLSVYPQLLKEHGVLADLKKFEHAPHFFKNPRLYQTYPDIACRFGESLFSVGPESKKGLFTLLRDEVRGKVSWPQLIKDAFAGWRGLS
jgi:electron transfer flavoprotein-quinone oxidoreductase